MGVKDKRENEGGSERERARGRKFLNFFFPAVSFFAFCSIFFPPLSFPRKQRRFTSSASPPFRFPPPSPPSPSLALLPLFGARGR